MTATSVAIFAWVVAGVCALAWWMGWSAIVPMVATVCSAIVVSVVVGRRFEPSSRGDLEKIGSELDSALDQLTPGVNAAGGAVRSGRDLAELAAIAGSVAERVRERVTASEARASGLASVLDALHEPVLVTNERGIVILRNREAEEFFQTLRGGLEGRSIEDLFTQADALRLHASAMSGVFAAGQVRFASASGVRVYEMVAAPVELAGDASRGVPSTRGVVLTLRDVTDLAMAVQLKTEFVANASHELRTPLSSIKGAVETLRDGALEDPPMAARLMEMIATNVVRLEELVRDLMDLSRLESPEAPLQVERIDLEALCQAMAKLFESVCGERRLAIEVRVEEAVRWVQSDRQLLQLVLQNLIDNATKFAFEGTTIRVECGVMGAGGVRLRVSDQGIGIPINQQQRIFERFFQVDSARAGGVKRRGTGLGLAIVKHAVKRLNGTIAVQSVWKQGTTMEVELPALPSTDPD